MDQVGQLLQKVGSLKYLIKLKTILLRQLIDWLLNSESMARAEYA